MHLSLAVNMQFGLIPMRHMDMRPACRVVCGWTCVRAHIYRDVLACVTTAGLCWMAYIVMAYIVMSYIEL